MPNIAFFGSSEYSLPVVQTLAESNNLNLKLLITKPGMKHYQELASKHSITLLTPETLKDKDKATILDALTKQHIDLAIVADYGLMIPDDISTLPQHGTLNIHFSNLPYLRGASPVQYTILRGEKQAWFTILELAPESEPKMDSGRILYKEPVDLNGSETTESLYTLLFEKAATRIDSIVTSYMQSPSELSILSQDHSLATFTTPSGMFDRTSLIKKEDAFITATLTAEEIERATRAFTPWPIAWTTLEELQKILKQNGEVVKRREKKNPDTKIQIHSATVDNGILKLGTIQAEGKKPAPWKEFKNGWFE